MLNPLLITFQHFVKLPISFYKIILKEIYLISVQLRGREPSIDASHQVSIHLAEGFQRRRLKCEKLMDDRRQVMAKAHIAFGKASNLLL
jgi:hypothetical protein